jgi:hypothetical protein
MRTRCLLILTFLISSQLTSANAAEPNYSNVDLPSLQSFNLEVKAVAKTHLKFTFTATISTKVNPVKSIGVKLAGPTGPKGNGLLGLPCNAWTLGQSGLFSKENFVALGSGLNTYRTTWISYYTTQANQFMSICPGDYSLFSSHPDIPAIITITDIADHSISYGLYSGLMNGNFNNRKLDKVPFITSNLWKEELSKPNCNNLFAFDSKYYFEMCEGPINFSEMIMNSKTTISALDIEGAPNVYVDEARAAEARAAEARAAEARAAEARAAEARAAEARAAEARAAEARAAERNKKTISCRKGNKIKKITSLKPICPQGFKKI